MRHNMTSEDRFFATIICPFKESLKPSVNESILIEELREVEKQRDKLLKLTEELEAERDALRARVKTYQETLADILSDTK